MGTANSEAEDLGIVIPKAALLSSGVQCAASQPAAQQDQCEQCSRKEISSVFAGILNPIAEKEFALPKSSSICDKQRQGNSRLCCQHQF